MNENFRITPLTPRTLTTALDVATVGKWLGYYAYAEQRLLEAQAGWLATIPLYELKIELSYQLYDDAHHVDALQQRLAELDSVRVKIEPPNEAFVLFLNELTNAEATIERLVGVYWVLRPHLADAYRRQLVRSNTVADQPTVRLLEAALRDHERFTLWGDALIWKLLDTPQELKRAQAWREHLEVLLANAGGVLGKQPDDAQAVTVRDGGVGRRFRLDAPRRDKRFDVAPAERREGRASAAVWDQQSFLTYLFGLLENEIELVEACGRTLYDFPDAPWAFRFSLARQLWDKARHAELALLRFLELGGALDLQPVRDTFPVYFAAVQQRDLGRRVANLHRNGGAWAVDDFASMVDICRQLDDERSARLFEQLVADERQHIKIGAEWIPQFMADDPKSRQVILTYRREIERQAFVGGVSDIAAAQRFIADSRVVSP